MTSAKNLNADAWTGGPSPPDKSRLDVWAHDHPWKTAIVGIVVIGLASVLRYSGTHSVTVESAILVFCINVAVVTATYGSMFLGVILFGKLIEKINKDAVSNLTIGQTVFVVILLLFGFVASINIGPFLVLKALSFLTVRS